MNKIYVAGQREIRDELLKRIMALGVVEISLTDSKKYETALIRNESVSENLVFYENNISISSEALKNLKKYTEIKSPLFYEKKIIKDSAILSETDKEKAVKTAKMINNLSQYITDAENEINRFNLLLAGLKPWIKLEVDLGIKGTEYTDIIFGTLPLKTKFNVVYEEIIKNVPTAVISKVSEDKQFSYICMICIKEQKDILVALVKKYGFSVVNVSEKEGTALQLITEYNKKIELIKNEVKSNKEKICGLAVEKELIEKLYDISVIGRDREKIVSNMIGTEKVFYFEGWIPEKNITKAEKLFMEYKCYCEFTKADESEDVPVLLSNSGIIEPFETITNMYSLPSKSDIDPTGLLAPFYFIFFGLMLSDAAYGLILSVVCFVALKKLRPEGSVKKIIKMFLYCGISTFFWGALFGSWFGDIVAVVSSTFTDKTITFAPIWFAPMDEPMKLLIFSIILGAVHLFTGMAIRAYILIKNGNTMDALFDIGLWYLLLIGLVLFAIGDVLAPVLSSTGMIMTITGVIGILLTGGRHKKGWLGKLAGGLGSLYGITNYLSDVLSYSRLLALGLATGVVASVVNQLGSLMGGGIMGAIVLIIVFVAGHTFNIAINILGAFVHACRLQYVEFFGKFYTGGGKPFKPFMYNTKYIKIAKEETNNG